MSKLSQFIKKRRKWRPDTFSQCGEDIIADLLLRHILGIKKPYYVDIGAHDPVKINNTFAMYNRGLKGVLVEPNLEHFNNIRRKRPRDLALNVGVAEADGIARYFQFDVDTLNTFNVNEAESYQEDGHKLIAVEEFEVISPSTLMEKHCEQKPDFVSLDIEGNEIQILESWNLSQNRPAVFCIETLEYKAGEAGKKKLEVFEYMQSKEYSIFADTFINTVFVDRHQWTSNGSLRFAAS